MGLVDMGKKGMNVEEGQDLVAVDPGEHKLKIGRFTNDDDKHGHAYYMAFLVNPSVPLAREVSVFLGLPHGEMDEKQLNNCRNKWKQFCHCFGIPTDKEVDLEDYVGSDGWVLLGKRDDDEYGERNNVKKFIQPK